MFHLNIHVLSSASLILITSRKLCSFVVAIKSIIINISCLLNIIVIGITITFVVIVAAVVAFEIVDVGCRLLLLLLRVGCCCCCCCCFVHVVDVYSLFVTISYFMNSYILIFSSAGRPSGPNVSIQDIKTPSFI